MYFDKRTKQIGTGIFIGWFLLTWMNGCLEKHNRTEKLMRQMSQASEQIFKDESPEVMFARLDNHPESVQDYASMIDQLDSSCKEDRNEVAALVFTVNQKNGQVGFNEPIRTTLSNYTAAIAVHGTEHNSCFDVYGQLRRS